MIKTRVRSTVKFYPFRFWRSSPKSWRSWKKLLKSWKKSWKVFKNREGFEDQWTKCTNIHDSNILLIVYLEYFVLCISCKSLRLIWWLTIDCVFELKMRKIGALRNFRIWKRWIPCMNQTIWYLIWYNLYDFKVTLVKWFRDWDRISICWSHFYGKGNICS